jgi:hypothetical protein
MKCDIAFKGLRDGSAPHMLHCAQLTFKSAADAPGTAEPLFIVGMVWGEVGPIHIFVNYTWGP